jgi:hypothetical protein
MEWGMGGSFEVKRVMIRKNLSIAAVALLALGWFAACGDGKEDEPGPTVISGYEFEISIEPSTFVPQKAEAVLVASDGDPKTNPPDTVQLFTPNNTLTWAQVGDEGVFSFTVILTSFYKKTLCDVHVVVDEISPPEGRYFFEDDRDTEYAGGVTGAGVWAYGDAASRVDIDRRWRISLKDHSRFTIRGRVLSNPTQCGRLTELP